MTIADIVYSIFIRPLQLFFEVVFMMVNQIVHNPGISIIVLSLTMNFLVLPLYKRADAMQSEERDMEAKLHKGVAHIKKTFKGDERMMILQTYYRQNDYKPTYVFRGAISLLLEIPFFIAAYQFLSHLEALKGVSFGVLHDLGAADALISVWGGHINLLPILMTAVNLVSCVIFTKGYPMKTKVQLYSMAVFFFFFLYSSPSGLVFYWTLNNLFSLFKTIFYKLKNAKEILQIMFAATGAALLWYVAFNFNSAQLKLMICADILGVAFILPLLISFTNKIFKRKAAAFPVQSNQKLFMAGVIFMVALVGCVIPTSVLKASPQEFVDVYYYSHPLWYVCSSLCLAVGTFFVWFGVFYWLADEKSKVYFEVGIWLICGIATINYMFFGKGLGVLSNTLCYEGGMSFTKWQEIGNFAWMLTAMIVLLATFRYWKKGVAQILVVGLLAFTGLSISNVVGIQKSVSNMTDTVAQAKADIPVFSLSKSGKNVVVLMLDRAMNEFLPYCMAEKPELKQMYSGFTYYPNTLSFGAFTNMGSPAVFGGYEYTPHEMNKRDTESLMSKHNEALKVMPVLFDKNGYRVTVCDPTYANYQWNPDLSIFNDYPGIHKYVTNGRFTGRTSKAAVVDGNKRNIFCYSVMKTLPLWVQPILYDNGNYYHELMPQSISGQTRESNYISNGINASFMNCYTVLENLPRMTEVTDDSKNTFLLMTNDTTHEPMLLQEPEYVPAEHVDNTDYEKEHAVRTAENGDTMQLQTEIQHIHYQTNMAALLKIGEWLEYLKDKDVYDNTRIIIVADHGRALRIFDKMILKDGSKDLYDTEYYYPLLLVKDFGSETFTTSDEFMTNGDVPTIALDGLIDNPVNPFTGKPLNNSEKYAHDQYVFGSEEFQTDTNNGNQYHAGIWFSVRDDVRNKDNWTILNENSTSPTER